MSWTKRIGYFVFVLVVISGGQALTDGGLDTSPEPVVQEVDKPTVSLVEQNAEPVGDSYEITATIQNTGSGGDVFTTLWLGADVPEEMPDTAAGLEDAGFSRARTGSFYFDSGERRAVSFTEDDMDGSQSYAIYGFASTYSATIANEGGAGDVNVSLVWRDTDTDATHVVSSRTVGFQQNQTRQVEFRVEEHPKFHYPTEEYDTWEIVAEPT